MDGVGVVNRVADPNVPDGGMGAAWLWSILQVEVTLENFSQLYGVVRDRLPGTPLFLNPTRDERRTQISEFFAKCRSEDVASLYIHWPGINFRRVVGAQSAPTTVDFVSP